MIQMNYIITGHRGIIGSYLKDRLDREGNVCVLKVDQREGFNVLDLIARELEVRGKRTDIFFHFAAQCKINESIAIPILAHRNNADGAFEVLEFCRRNGIKKIVVASTSRVLSPEINPYVASKIYVEKLTEAYRQCYGIDYIIVRPSTVYGPMFDETSRLINNFLVAALKNEPLKIFGDSEKTLDFTYIDDFVEGVMLAMNKGEWNKAYNISGDSEIRVLSVAQEIIRQTGSTSEIIFQEPERAQPQKVRVDNSELRKLGYNPKVGIKEGISKMLSYYHEHPEAWKNYVDKGQKYYNSYSHPDDSAQHSNSSKL
jgi:nucleoside-diphosphate-sugar epimerase